MDEEVGKSEEKRGECSFEHLHSVFISHQKESIVIQTNTSWILELSFVSAFTADIAKKAVVVVALLIHNHSMIEAIRNKNVAILAHDDII